MFQRMLALTVLLARALNIAAAQRSLRRTPVFSTAVILTLALGLATVGSMFAIVYGVLLAPLPYGEPDRLVSIGLRSPTQDRIPQPPALAHTYQQFAKSLEAVAFYRSGNANIWSEADGGTADSSTATWVTGSMMPLLRATPLLGRSFTADEEVRGGPNAVILSESEWRTRFKGAHDVIGKTLVVNSAPRQIVGVMPAHFVFPTAATRVWLPVKTTDSGLVEDFSYSGVARLAAGISAQQAQAELAALIPRMAQLYPRLQSGAATSTWLDELKPTLVVLSLRDDLTGRIAQTLWLLAGAAALVLLAAWASVVNLMLIRADGRQAELAVRAALGAGRLRIATHFLGESLLLGATAGLLALLLTMAAIRALLAFGPTDIPRLAELGVGLPTVAFIALLGMVGVLLCVALPTLRIGHGNLSRKLHDGARGHSTGKSRQRLRASLTVVQIALALVVTVGSALLLRTAHRLSEVHPGFEASELTSLQILLPHATYRDASTVDFYARLTERVRQLPTVRAAGLTGKLPLGPGWLLQQSLLIDGHGKTPSLPVNVVDDGYFAAMQIPLLAGRGFRSLREERGGDILISQNAALTYFDDPSGVGALGKRMTLAPNGPAYTIVGVVGDVRDRDLTIEPTAMIYRPQVVPIDPNLEPGPRPSLLLVVRSSGPGTVPAIRQIVAELDPTVPVFNVQPMDEVVAASTARLSLALALLTTAAFITLLLGMIGLYGVMAYMVALRTREFGIRIALGADPRRITRWVACHGLLLTGCGIAAGFVLYALAAPFLRAFLYGVTVTDPATLIGAALLLTATAVLASWLPAQRAARVDPGLALRAE